MKRTTKFTWHYPALAGCVLLAAALLVAGCNTVRGAGEDVRSVGRVFSHNPNGNNPNGY